MTKTLLAVDDSVTMRKVLEITFSGEDFHVLTAENAQSALGKASENPAVFVVDTVLGGEDGYALAKELRKRSPGAAIVLLASRYAPYDQARGRDAGADDWADKPFDTQQLIDKVKKVLSAKEAGGPVAAAPPPAPSAPAPIAAPAPAPPPAATAPVAIPTPRPTPQPVPGAPRPGSSPSLGRSTQQSLGGAAASARTGTLVFGEQAPSPAPPPAARPASPARAAPTAPQPIAAPPPAVAAAVNGQLAGKLDGLGLSPSQADAVLALSREVVEKVVWEVVPQLAETLIKEEIARLMKA